MCSTPVVNRLELSNTLVMARPSGKCWLMAEEGWEGMTLEQVEEVELVEVVLAVDE